MVQQMFKKNIDKGAEVSAHSVNSFHVKKNKLRWTVPKTCLDPPNRTSPSEKWRFRSARLNDHGPIMGFQRCPLPRHPFPKNEQGFAPSLSFTWFFNRKIKKNKSFSTKIKESHHLSHLGEGCVTLLLPYSPWIPIFSQNRENPSAPRLGLGTADSRGPQKGRWVPRWVRRFHGGRRIFWRCPRVNPGNFRELPIFRPTFHGQVGGFEKSADSEAFGGDLWIPLDSWNSGPRGRHYQNYPNHPQVYRVLETNWSKCPKN